LTENRIGARMATAVTHCKSKKNVVSLVGLH
jgi:hypothetical protein